MYKRQGYNRLSGKWTGAQSFGKNTLVGKVRLGTSLGGDMPFYDQFSLGGFQVLSGYANEQFRGNDVAFGVDGQSLPARDLHPTGRSKRFLRAYVMSAFFPLFQALPGAISVQTRKYIHRQGHSALLSDGSWQHWNGVTSAALPESSAMDDQGE